MSKIAPRPAAVVASEPDRTVSPATAVGEFDPMTVDVVEAVTVADAAAVEPFVEVRLTQVPLRQSVEVLRIDLPADETEPLLERGILPGCSICPVRRSPSGDPIVMVDGVVIAMRKEMAACLCVRMLESISN